MDIRKLAFSLLIQCIRVNYFPASLIAKYSSLLCSKKGIGVRVMIVALSPALSHCQLRIRSKPWSLRMRPNPPPHSPPKEPLRNMDLRQYRKKFLPNEQSKTIVNSLLTGISFLHCMRCEFVFHLQSSSARYILNIRD